MNWIDKITTREQQPRHYRQDRSTGVRAELNEQQRSWDELSPRHNGHTFEYAHETKLIVGTVFYANQAQLPERSKVAARAIVEYVFQPYLSRRSRLFHAAHDGNQDELLDLLRQIDEEIGA